MKSLNVDESTVIVGPNTSKRETKTLLNLFNRADDLIEIRPVAGVEFGMEEFAIGANFEGATARRDERERLDTLAEFKDLGRQTDGLGRVVSNHAIFDRYFGFHVRTPFRFKARISERSGQWFWPLYFLREARSR